jgi:hypothetical protein
MVLAVVLLQTMTQLTLMMTVMTMAVLPPCAFA